MSGPSGIGFSVPFNLSSGPAVSRTGATTGGATGAFFSPGAVTPDMPSPADLALGGNSSFIPSLDNNYLIAGGLALLAVLALRK